MRHQRKLRNLLLDRHFQLKYAGYLVALALVLSLALGAILWKTSAEVVQQSRANADHGARIVELGKEVVLESQKVSAVVRMNIVRDPVYQDNPELLAAFNSDAAEQDQRLEAQNQQLEAQRLALKSNAQMLESSHRRLLLVLILALSSLVVGVGIVGIFVTHKVAGPIFKMTRHFRDVAADRLLMPNSLRRGDELVVFFGEFRQMLLAVRERREETIVALDTALESLEGKVGTEELQGLRLLRAQLQAGLDSPGTQSAIPRTYSIESPADPRS